MADILQFTDGVTTIDFISGSSDYVLLDKGLDIALPEVNRVVSELSPLVEGQRLSERQYGLREITIIFKITAVDHDALVSDLRAIQKLIDKAKEQSKAGFGNKVELQYKFENATDTVTFDVMDGEFKPGQFASVVVKREPSLLMDCELTLLCEPFARGTPVIMRNFLVNPSFDWNPGEAGRDFGLEIDLNGSTQRLHRTSPTGLFPTAAEGIMSAGIWVNPDVTPTLFDTMMVCGDTTESWQLRFEDNNSVALRQINSVGSITTLTSDDDVVPNDTWSFVWFSVFMYRGAQWIVLGVNDSVVAGSKRTSDFTFKTAVGDFVVGASDAAGGNDFDGKVGGIFVIAGGRPILPYQIIYMYHYGLQGLIDDTGIMDVKYWGLEAADFGAVWIQESGAGDILDVSGNSRDLTVIGSPTRSPFVFKPSGWTQGSSFASSSDSGLESESTPKYGLFSCRFKETGGGDANMYIEQDLTISPSVDGMTILFWARQNLASGAIEIEREVNGGGATTKELAGLTTDWQLYKWTTSIVTITAFRLRLKWTQGGFGNVDMDGIQVLPGLPFGSQDPGGDIPVELITRPFIGSHQIVVKPNSTKVNFVALQDFPGDVPATCRVSFKNTSSGKQLAPIRLGARFGVEPWKQQMIWNASSFIIDPDDGAYPAADEQIRSDAAVTLKRRFHAVLSSLFPFPSDQYGSHRLYIGAESNLDLISMCQLRFGGITGSTVPLISAPQKGTVTQSDVFHLVDGGILTWPPETALQRFRDGDVTSASRLSGDAELTPGLEIVNIADAAISNLLYNILIALPIDHGSAILQPSNSLPAFGLQENEILTIDTMDEEAISSIYFSREVVTPDSAFTKTLTELASPDVAAMGLGFRIQPESPGMIAAVFSEWGAANDDPFGKFVETHTAELWLEYTPRFLYV
ncbi:hypothetical protein LCGC14_0448700 [marine sediment metagenome]|uniref:Uncharacterized protein n=1 Tax=marine sediment metagenome TaxID=412755 RepID=A0A0F9SNX6_9ZZZZ